MGAGSAWFRWDWPRADKELERAVKLYPSDTEARLNYALMLGSTGRLSEGMAQAKRAVELDPLNLAAYSIVGWHYYALRQYGQAIEECQTGLEIDPHFFILYWILWRALREAGRLEEAMKACMKMLSFRGNGEAVAPMEQGYSESGYRGAMLGAATFLSGRFGQNYFPPSDIAILFRHAEEKEEALRWLEIAVQEQDPRLHTMALDPEWDGLRSEPRFQAILQRINLAEIG
jgi:tetratricopeptide (TPR) repeat protein